MCQLVSPCGVAVVSAYPEYGVQVNVVSGDLLSCILLMCPSVSNHGSRSERRVGQVVRMTPSPGVVPGSNPQCVAGKLVY